MELADVLCLRLSETPHGNALYLVYKNILKKSLGAILLPNFDVSLLAQINSEWNTCRLNCMHVNDDDVYRILWSGIQISENESCKEHKSLSVCQFNQLGFTIKLCHVCDILFDNEDELEGNGNLTIKYAQLQNYLSDNVVEKTLEIKGFGDESAFDQLSVLWRQELQLQMIEDLFGDQSSLQESALATFTKERREAIKAGEESGRNVAQSSYTIRNPAAYSVGTHNLRRADSMRRIYKPKDMKHAFPTPASSYGDFHRTELETVIETDSIHTRATTNDSAQEKQSEVSLDSSPAAKKSISSQTAMDSKDDEPTIIRQRSISNPFDTLNSIIADLTLTEEEQQKRRYTENVMPRRLSNTLPARSANRVSIMKQPPKIPDLFEATYPYPQAGAGEMVLEKGDKMRVIRRDASGWWYGLKLVYKREGLDMRWVVKEEGWVPSNYLKEVS